MCLRVQTFLSDRPQDVCSTSPWGQIWENSQIFTLWILDSVLLHSQVFRTWELKLNWGHYHSKSWVLNTYFLIFHAHTLIPEHITFHVNPAVAQTLLSAAGTQEIYRLWWLKDSLKKRKKNPWNNCLAGDDWSLWKKVHLKLPLSENKAGRYVDG